MNKEKMMIKQSMDSILEKEHTSIGFEDAWAAYEQIKKPKRRLKIKKALVIIAATVCLATGAVVSADYMIRQDKVDYPFKNDKKVLGTWRVVDFVEYKEDFVPGKRQWQGDPYLREMSFNENGQLAGVLQENQKLIPIHETGIGWTAGMILNDVELTAAAYDIETINGREYMFYEWKNGDYIMRGEDPNYYVLEKMNVESEVLKVENNIPQKVKVDNIDLFFIDNNAMLGEWQAVDFVKEIADFNPSKLQWAENELVLKGVTLQADGKTGIDFGKGVKYYDNNTWTGDVIISKADQTASKCTIQEVDGQTYMFYEWKSGDYTIRGMKPYYYVLKKIE